MISPNSSFLGLKMIDLSDDTTVASGGGSDTQTLQPPQGQIYKIIELSVDIPDPVGSSANYHRLSIGYQNFTDSNDIIFIQGNFGTDIRIYNGGLGGDVVYPADDNNQLPLKRTMIYASYTEPLDFVYTNNTDVNQTGTRKIEIMTAVYKDLI